MRRVLEALLPAFGVFLLSPPAGAADAPPRLFVLDGHAPAVHAVDANTGRILQTATLTGQPSVLGATPDGSRLLVLDRGPGKDAGDRGWAATGRSSITVVDADAMQVVGRVELGWGLALDHPLTVSPDGRRAAVLCPGYQAKKPQERQPTELVVIDVAAVKEVGRVTLDRPPLAWTDGSDGRRICALLPRPDSKDAPGGSASLVVVDVETGARTGALPLEGDVAQLVPSPDGRLLYALDRGKPSGKAEKNVDGRVHVISPEPLALVASLDAGSGPRGAFFEASSGALLVLSQTAPVKGGDMQGELLVVRGEKLEASVPVANAPLFLRRSPDGRQLYAVGEKSLKVLSLPSCAAVRDVPIEGAGTNWTSDTQPGPPNDLVVTPDGSRGLLTYENSSKLLVLDLSSGTKAGSVTTGRKGAKLAKMAEVTAINAASYYSAREAAIHSGSSVFFYDVYGIRAASTNIALRPDGRFAYVLNSLTNDVTVVDTVGVTAVDKIPVGGRELLPLPSGRFVAIVSPTSLDLLDTTSNAVSGKWELSGLLPLLLTPDRPGVVVAISEKTVMALDPSTGQVGGRVDSFVGNTDGAFVERRSPRAEPAPKKAADPPPSSRPKSPKPGAKAKPS